MVTAEFKWLGLQDRVENYMLKSQQRMFTIFHRKIYCWMDQWYGLTMKDIQLLEERIQKELDLVHDFPLWLFKNNGLTFPITTENWKFYKLILYTFYDFPLKYIWTWKSKRSF